MKRPIGRASSFLNIVAHEDDDLLFMNPDISTGIHDGSASTTVYLTAGEASFPPGDRYADSLPGCGECKKVTETISREQYIDCRRRGVLTAYKRIISRGRGHEISRQEMWGCQLLDIGDGRRAERFVSAINADVSLIFLQLPEHADTAAEGGPGALRNLWHTGNATARTVAAAGSPLRGNTFVYDRESLIGSLLSIMRLTHPTVIRIQDFDPDPRYQEKWENHDHPDHIMAGLFASRASVLYAEERSFDPPAIVGYRAYNIADAPVNLRADVTRAEKEAAFWNYAAYDREIHQGNHQEYEQWLPRMYHRWSDLGNWADRNEEGFLSAFAVLGGDLWSWREENNGSWTRRNLGRPPGRALVPGIAVARTVGGRLCIFAVGYGEHPTAQAGAPALFMIRDPTRHAGPPMWTDLGTPPTSGGPGGPIGPPATVTDLLGRIWVFLRNADGGLSGVGQPVPDSSFGVWTNHGGADIQDAPVAIMAPGGQVEIFASTTTSGLLHWKQAAHTGMARLQRRVPSPVPSSSPAAAVGQDGRLEVYVRIAGTGHVAVSQSDGTVWKSGPILRGPGGTGPVSTLGARGSESDGRITLLVRNAHAGISMYRRDGTSQDRHRATWIDLGHSITGTPALAVNNNGRAVVLALGTDGALYTAEQDYADGGSDFGPWRRCQSTANVTG